MRYKLTEAQWLLYVPHDLRLISSEFFTQVHLWVLYDYQNMQ
jgi:hypothetical protein